jgi:DNA-binding SARP family transcriptional activator/tetratricopeptide (TPR) repeat protein
VDSQQAVVAFRLQTFGGLAICASDGALTTSASRRRSLALLALAASNGDDGVSAERAMALLWPEFDAARARNNLKQLVFALRSSLGPDIFVRSAATMRLNPAIISVDLWDFEQRIRDGKLEEAIGISSGPFLEGFHLAGLQDFSRWIESERSRIALSYVETLQKLAAQAESPVVAVGWWRARAAHDPLSEKYAEGLVLALARTGDVNGALQSARTHATLVRQELELEPGPALRELTEALRLAQISGRKFVPKPAPATIDRRQVGATISARVAASNASLKPDAAPLNHGARAASNLRKRLGSPFGLSRREVSSEFAILAAKARLTPRQLESARQRRWAIRIALSAIALVSVAGVSRAVINRQAQPGPVASKGTELVVYPFSIHGDAGTLDLGSAVAELLAAGLDGTLGLRAVHTDAIPDARAARPSAADSSSRGRWSPGASATAGVYLSGEIFGSGDRLRINAEIIDRTGATEFVEHTSVEGDRTQLLSLVDQLAAQVLATRVDGSRGSDSHLASVTTSSLQAAKAYFTGQTEFRAGRFGAAKDAFSEALRRDSAFALASYGLSTVADVLGENELALRAAVNALDQSPHLPSRQRRLLTAYVARQRGDAEEAERLYAQLTVDYPSDDDGWMGLAETLFHLNPLRGRDASEAREDFRQVTLIDPGNIAALVHLARIATLQGNSPDVIRYLTRARALATDAVVGRVALHVLSLGGPEGGEGSEGVDRDHLERTSSRLSGPSAIDLLVSVDMDGLDRFGAQFIGYDLRPGMASYGLMLRALVAAGRGRVGAAMALLDTCATIDPSVALEARTWIASLPFVRKDRTELEQIRNELTAWKPAAHTADASLDSIAHTKAHPYLRLYRIGLVSLRLEDTTAVARVARQLRDMAESPDGLAIGATFALSLRARLAADRGQLAEALGILDKARWDRATNVTRLEAYDRLLRAELLEKLGHADEALGYYRQLGSRSPYELPLLWPAELGIARILVQRGDSEQAEQYCHRVAERLRDADPGVRENAAIARHRVRGLAP